MPIAVHAIRLDTVKANIIVAIAPNLNDTFGTVSSIA